MDNQSERNPKNQLPGSTASTTTSPKAVLSESKNDPSSSISSADLDNPYNSDLLLERLLHYKKINPHAPCATILGEGADITASLTAEEWINKANALAKVLKNNGIQPDDRVILSLPTSEEFLVSFLALWWIGAVPVPLPEPSPRIKKGSFHERLIHVIADCTPKAIIVPNNGKKLFFDIEDLAVQLSEVTVWEWPQLEEQSRDFLSISTNDLTPVPQEQDHIAFIQYTSGSTGIPKGVVVTHGCVRANVQAMGRASGMSSQDKILTWMPLYHDMGLVGGVLFPAYFQTHLYLIPTNQFLGNPKIWLKSISQYRITLSTSPNFVYNLCARRINPKDIAGLDLSSWRLAYNGAEPIDTDTLRLFQEKFGPFGFSKTTFYPVYGMAEATLAIAFPPPGSELLIENLNRKSLVEDGRAVLQPPFIDPAQSELSSIGATKNPAVTPLRGEFPSHSPTISLVSVGKCLPDHQILIRDTATSQVLEDGQVGEICFTGPSVSPGYFRERKWDTHPTKELKTGDLGYLREGNLFIVDRLKDLILIAGANYYPSDIEREIHKIAGIRPGRSVAFGVSDGATGTSALVIIAEISRSMDLDELKKEIRSRIYATHGLVPRDIILTREKKIPLTSSGKIMRRKCHELYIQGEMLINPPLAPPKSS